MSQRSKPRRGPGSRRPSSSKSPPSPRENGGNGDGRRASGAAETKPSNGRANGNGRLEKRLLEQAGEAARSAPAIREDLVARYRKLIAEGRYHPDPKVIAERMIRKGLLRDL